MVRYELLSLAYIDDGHSLSEGRIPRSLLRGSSLMQGFFSIFV